MRRMISFLMAGMIGCSLLHQGGSVISAVSDMETGNRETAKSDIIDLVLMFQKWFLGYDDVNVDDMDAVDFNGDVKVNIADLCYMKSLLVEDNGQSDSKQVNPPVKALDPDLPSVGTDNIPVFAVNFPDCEFEYDDITEKLQKTVFSPEDKDDPLYPLESVTAYYDRASYGRLKLEGNVFEYTAEQPIGSYLKSSARSLVSEIMTAFDDTLNYNDYDADGDKKLDTMVLIFPDAAIELDDNHDKFPDWWPYSTTVISKEKYDDVAAGTFCVIAYDDEDQGEFNTRIAHELGHAMGLEDYYQAADNLMTDNEGLPGPAGIELMDEGTGDLSACSKLLLGWLDEDEIQIYNGGTKEFTLTSMQYSPSCIIIPKDPSDLYLSEYFIIEYITKEGNNSVCGGNGIRILHVNTDVSYEDKMFTYSRYGKHYDTSNEKQRILRLVNDFGIFYPGTPGRSFINQIDGQIEGFHWYNKYGNMTLDTGLTITFSELKCGPEFEWGLVDMSSSGTYYNLPEYIRGSSYTITITDAAE
ncbi:hypothetical protein [Ruminococcus sp. HUN007]|uniref:hypothetical protein n=1 Tax=Ruminococcus sp. HUN007 TaxID=1514668 RepID=UPI0005D29A3F|nr:hypothetical protein [Ruminococcus sp. HUN007]